MFVSEAAAGSSDPGSEGTAGPETGGLEAGGPEGVAGTQSEGGLAGLPLERLEHEIVQLAAHVNAGMARWLELVAEFDRREGWGSWTGCRSTAEWVAWRCALEPRAAREHVRVARRLTELPATRSALADGSLSYSKARALTRAVTPASEEELLELAEHATAAQLERVCSALRRVSAAEAGRARENRFLAWFWEDDGSLSIHGSLPPEDGAALLAALEAARARLWGTEPSPDEPHDPQGCGSAEPHEGPCERGSAEPPEDSCEGGSAGPPEHPCVIGSAEPLEPRRVTNADALVEMAAASVGPLGEPRSRHQGGRGDEERPGGEEGRPGPRTELIVHVDAATLVADGDGRCHIEHGQAISPETARRLGCDAALVSVPERAGEPLSVGRRSRTVPAAINRALRSRDGTCCCPGCESRHGLDAHHVRHWAHGGETSLDNLVRLCRRHHRLLHEGGFSVEPAAGEPAEGEGTGGELRFRDRHGHVIPESPGLPAGSRHQLARTYGWPRSAPWPGSGERLDLHYALSILDRRAV
ncbi:MAG: DUF222 domain-containing protein [Solirubrobacterales bacterium]